jgi:undecaprenyl diphosphate synthase
MRPTARPDKGMRVNFLADYGWEWDMKNNWASREIPRIDLVIRWGGMCRLSGFLPVQTVYSDIYIVKELWPDFQEQQFEDALNWYRKQDVTLGG